MNIEVHRALLCCHHTFLHYLRLTGRDCRHTDHSPLVLAILVIDGLTPYCLTNRLSLAPGACSLQTGQPPSAGELIICTTFCDLWLPEFMSKYPSSLSLGAGITQRHKLHAVELVPQWDSAPGAHRGIWLDETPSVGPPPFHISLPHCPFVCPGTTS